MADATLAAPAAPAAPVVPAAAPPTVTKADAPKDALKAAPAAKEAPAGKDAKVEAVAKEVQKQLHKLIVDGKEEEVDVDELIRRAQISTAADKRFKEASQAKKEAQEKHAQVASLLKLMTEDPREFSSQAKAYGVDPEKFATAILQPLLEEQIAVEEERLMNPEQRKQRELEKKLQAYERQEVARKADAEKAEKEKQTASEKAQVEKMTNEFATQILEAMKATKLPQTPDMALEIHALLTQAVERGLPIKPEQLARDLEAKKQADLNALLKASGKADWIDPEYRKLIRQEAINDPEIIETIRKNSIKEFKKTNPMAAATPVVGNPADKSPKSQKRTMGAIMRDIALKKL